MTIMVTGHRPNKLWGYDLEHPKYQQLKERFKAYLIKYNADTAISGMALGVDTLFAQAVLELKTTGTPIKLVCAIPCQAQSSMWPKSSQVEYERILHQADKVVLVSDKPYAAYLMQIRNQWMADHSDRAIAVWDGTPGGTANCINYLQKINKPIHYIKIIH